jgi:hypothetical protein
MSFWSDYEKKVICAMNGTTFPFDFTLEEREHFEELKKTTDAWRDKGFIYKVLHPGEHQKVRWAIVEMQEIILAAYDRKSKV